MAQRPKHPRIIKLSRFFDANVQLVAGVCATCYSEQSNDVKIVAVNRRFLKSMEHRTNARDNNTTHNEKKPDCECDYKSITPAPKINYRNLGNNNNNGKSVTYLDEPLWWPPRSPHNLIEESLFRDPWSLLVATIFLNKTSCKCAKPRLAEFLKDFSGPVDVIARKPEELERYFLDLGLYRKRAEQVWRMSHDYLYKDWKNPKELYGIGRYGDDAYRIFILGDLENVPGDRFLRIYRDWAKMDRRKSEENCKSFMKNIHPSSN